ncbi:hypothetical protein [Nocardia iowensis]|uniref:CHAP domain-containing protein n=1 Tax=Nocardia iowensis TaxID=204891 RepID=A0ABX8S2C6_NOCIO|nr:hypothetical protein [Nocardia iowensis]QXN94710.1 hypothetical protein KV110_17645 [Nocardia iowensis]
MLDLIRVLGELTRVIAENATRATRALGQELGHIGGSITGTRNILVETDIDIARQGQQWDDRAKHVHPTHGGSGSAAVPTPDESVATHIARAGWRTGPKTLRMHVTDAGTEIPPTTWQQSTAAAPDGPHLYASRAGLVEVLRNCVDAGVELDRLDPLGPIDPHFNCHGYTFSSSGEAGWLSGRSVDRILADNGFRRISDVSAVAPGDVVVYRNAAGGISHSGVVADATSDGIYVDAKFSSFAVTRHEIRELAPLYGADVEFYHTDRPGGRFLEPVEHTEVETHWPAAPPEQNEPPGR